MALPNVATSVHGDVEKVDALRLKQGPQQDVGQIVDSGGGRPPAEPGLPSPQPRPPSLQGTTVAAGLSPDTIAAYIRVMSATANAERWQMISQMDVSPQTKLLAEAAILEARDEWRLAREATPWFDEADL